MESATNSTTYPAIRLLVRISL